MRLFNRTDDQADAETLAHDVDTIHRVMARTPGGAAPLFGAPTHCPSCGEWGLIDGATPERIVNHCYRCGDEWQISRRALRRVTIRAVPDLEAGVVPGDRLGLDLWDRQAASRARHPSRRVAVVVDS